MTLPQMDFPQETTTGFIMPFIPKVGYTSVGMVILNEINFQSLIDVPVKKPCEYVQNNQDNRD